MAPLSIDFDGDLNHAITDLPSTVTINAVEYSVITETLTRGQESELEGLYGDHTLKVHIRTADLASVAVGQLVTFNGQSYRAVEVDSTPDGNELILNCEETNTNA